VKGWADSGLMPLDYIGSLYERGNKHSTVKVRRSILNTFFNWQVSVGYTKKNPLVGTTTRPADVGAIKALTVPEVGALIRGCMCLGRDRQQDVALNLGRWPVEAYRARLEAMVSLQVSSGLRVAELLALRDEDIKLQDRTGYVKGKGRKERPIRFGKPAKRAIIRWQAMRDDLIWAALGQGAEINHLFIGASGGPLDPTTYRDQLAEASWWAGLGRVNPHLLRHTFATQAAAAGTPVEDLRDMLGHANIVTTMRYVHERDRDRAWRDLDARTEGTESLDSGGIVEADPPETEDEE
jgi:integrase/recombinase XerC